MKKVPIFAEHIWSIQYNGHDKCVFDELFDDDVWFSIEYLKEKYERNEDWIKSGPWAGLEETQWIIEARNEAENFYDRFLDIDESGSNDWDSMFYPLSKNEYYLEYERKKSYSREYNDNFSIQPPSFFRLYAIKIDDNKYIITGGTIKYAKNMNTHPDMKEQLNHINEVRKWIINNKITF